MRVRQRAYLSVKSHTLAPPEISELLGLVPTEAEAMGASDRVSGTPRSHLWSLASGVGQAAPLHDHLEALLPILQSHKDALRVLSRHESTMINLLVVRYFDDGQEDFDEATYGLDPDEEVSIRFLDGRWNQPTSSCSRPVESVSTLTSTGSEYVPILPESGRPFRCSSERSSSEHRGHGPC